LAISTKKGSIKTKSDVGHWQDVLLQSLLQPLLSFELCLLFLQQSFAQDFLGVSFLQQTLSGFELHAKALLGIRKKPSRRISNMRTFFAIPFRT